MSADSQQNQRKLTYGEQLVGLNFNPNQDPRVKSIKEKYAVIIDELHEMPQTGDPIQAEIMKSAIGDALRAQMMAVKAATWKANTFSQ